MKTILSMIVAAGAVAGSAGLASAQSAQAVAPSGFESVLPFAGLNSVVSGRSAYVGRADTGTARGIGPDGQGRLAPHINGIF